MPRRHPVPRIWLMTDERMGDALWSALYRLPRGSGVVVRHYGWPLAARHALLDRILRIGGRRGLVVIGTAGLRSPDGTHNGPARHGLRTVSAHHRKDVIAAERAGVDAVFVSPVFATRSHPGQRALGIARFAALLRGVHVPVIALGGMTPHRARHLPPGVHGWAAIDAWIEQTGRRPAGR